MKSRLNYKSRKTIIITAIIIALLALSATGIYMFTKGNDEARAFTEGNTMVEGSESPVVIPEQGNTPEEPTVEPNIGSENNGEQTPNGATTNQGTTNAPQTGAQAGTTTSTTAPNVPNQEYVTERQEEVERLTEENFLVSWNPISLAAMTTNIQLDELNEEAKYEVSKVATLVNGEAIRNENGEFTTRVKAGDKVTYVITVKNTGKVTIKNIEVVDELADYEATIPVLAIGDSKELKVTYTVKQEDMTENDTILNVAKVTVPGKPEEEPKEEIPADPYITVNGEKRWIDNNNKENTRPESITVKVLNGETVVDTIKVTAESEWKYTSKELPKYDDENKEIKYTVLEDAVEKYTTNIEGTIITNTIAQDSTVSVSGSKTWIAPEGTTHPTITINLLRDGEKVDSKELANGTTTYSFDNLDKYDLTDGHVYEYTVSEDTVEGYTSVQNGRNFTNTIAQDSTVSVSGSKTWIAPEGTTHPTITINLLRDGEKVDSKELTNGIATYSFDNLDKYDLTDGHVYEYTVSEDTVEGYTSVQNGRDFTNTIAQDSTVSVSGSKTWIAPEGTTHPTITINLLRDGEKVDSKELANGTTTYSFDNLDKYDLTDGHVYEYTVSEDTVEGYTSVQNGRDFTNTIAQDSTVSVSGSKTWIAPEGTTHPTITINLLRDGEKVDSKELANGTTTYSFDNLDKYDLTDGHVYEYTVSEDTVEGYTSVQNGRDFTNTIAQDSTVSVSGIKTWIAPEGTTHPTITINLLRDGEKVDSKELENGTTTYSFDNLDKYDLTDGHVYEYTVSEDTVEGYTSAQNGRDFTNTIAQDSTVSVSGSKTWIAPEGTTHPTITINLLRDGEKVDSKELTNGITTYSFDNLDKYDLTDGHVYEYTVSEDTVEGYTSVQNGRDFTNTINQEETNITVSKKWEDASNQDGNRLNSIKVQLFADDVAKEGKIVTLTTNNTDIWQYTYTGLNKYDLTDGHIIKYEVKELSEKNTVIESEGTNGAYKVNYEKDIEHNIITITNSYTPEKVNGNGEIEVTKVWSNDTENTRKEVTINLLADGKQTGKTLTLSATNGWTGKFTDLPKNANGNEITYTITENQVEGYTTTITGNVSNGFKVTNTYLKPEITVAKTSTLYRNGKVVTEGPAMYGDTIRYTITATNKGNAKGSIAVTDWVPEGTTLKENGSTNLTANELKALTTKEGLTKTLTVEKANGNTPTTQSIYFEVTVNANSNTEVKNIAKLPDGTEVPEEGHKVEKTVSVKAQTQTTTITNSNVVIVLDRSQSMDDKKATYKGKEMTRMNVAKKVVKDFIDTINLPEDGKGCAVSVVTFNGPDHYTSNVGTKYTDVLEINGGKTIATTANDAKNLKDAVDGVKAKNGTVIAGALTRAKTQIDEMKKLYPDNKNIVIFIGDGDPDGDRNDENNIPGAAKALKDTGATVYAIGFGQNVKVLRETVASSTDKYYTTSSTIDLSSIFTEIKNDFAGEAVLTTSIDGLIELTDINMNKTITLTVNGRKTEIAEGQIIYKNGKYYLDTTKFAADASIEIDYVKND